MNQSHDREILARCPYCNSEEQLDWGKPIRGFISVQCYSCGLIYIKNRFNADGNRKYYENYYSSVHQSDIELNKQRAYMYKLEFDLINSFVKSGRILDIGCGGGGFLDYFNSAGYDCYGVEFGKKAASIAAKKYKVFEGDFLDFSSGNKFDLIIFRGVIEHIPSPKSYLQRAVSLLRQQGCIYITSTPNAESFCCKLFREQWNQHEPEAHIMHFSPRHFDDYFSERGLKKIWQQFFYEETPYCNIEKDIEMVAKAISLKKQSLPIDFRSPAFYSNMMSLIYSK